jgi:hypothetical protein
VDFLYKGWHIVSGWLWKSLKEGTIVWGGNFGVGREKSGVIFGIFGEWSFIKKKKKLFQLEVRSNIKT